MGLVPADLSEAKINRGIDDSLKRIGTDYLDIYFCHRYDPDTPLEETVSAMGRLVQQGKIRHWGTRTWSAAQIARAHKIAMRQGVAPPMVEQPELNLIDQLDYKVNTLAARHECSQAQLAIAWVMAQPGVSSVITGASRVGQLIDNMGAAQITLPEETISSLDRIYAPSRLRRIKRQLKRFIRSMS
jgi:aryl-alcohol dehydrogenase-like predicted oxidoreductase